MPAISTHCGRSSSQAMNSGLGFRSHALVRREQRSENPEAAVLPFVGFRPLNWRLRLRSSALRVIWLNLLSRTFLGILLSPGPTTGPFWPSGSLPPKSHCSRFITTYCGPDGIGVADRQRTLIRSC
jgi:hypothetical protein